MPDTLRIVTFNSGGRPVETLNLNSAPGAVTAYFRERGSFQFTPAVGNVQYSRTARRYGGGRAVGETHDNGSIAWTAYVRGSTLATATANVEALVTAINDEARGRFVEWCPEGGQSSFLEIAGPGTWVPIYDPVEFVQTNAMRVQLVFPTLPLVRWISPTIADEFAFTGLASITDYTFDSLTAAHIANNGGWVPTGGSLTTERRARHTGRGYDHLEGQSSLMFTVGLTLSGFKVGVLFRATSALNYIEVYVDDNGTNSRLRIDVVIAGVRTNRSSVNLAARLLTNTPYYMRGRVRLSGVTGAPTAVVAEHFLFSNPPGTLTTPNNQTTYSLVVGDAPLNTVAGKTGITLNPADAFSTIHHFDFAPYMQTDSGMTAPRIWTPLDNLYGTAPALADVTLSASGGSLQPVFALIAWCPRPTRAPYQGYSPFNVMPAVLGVATGVAGPASDFTNWTTSTIPADLSGQILIDTSVVGAETYTVAWHIDPSILPPDEFSEEILFEVWARMMFSTTVVQPTVVPSIRSAEGTAFGGERYSNEWGATGQVMLGSGFRQFYRLGTVSAPTNPVYQRTVKFWITLTTGVGSTGTVMLDHIIMVPARNRCLSPTGKVLNSTYPSFIASTAATDKTVRSDLSGLVNSGAPAAAQSGYKMPDHGLGGSLIEPPPGAVDWIVKLSVQVPGDPTVQSASEPSSQNCSLRIDYIPRSYMLRTS